MVEKRSFIRQCRILSDFLAQGSLPFMARVWEIISPRLNSVLSFIFATFLEHIFPIVKNFDYCGLIQQCHLLVIPEHLLPEVLETPGLSQQSFNWISNLSVLQSLNHGNCYKGGVCVITKQWILYILGFYPLFLLRRERGIEEEESWNNRKDVLNSHKVSYCCLPKRSTIHIRKHTLYTHIMHM